MLWSHPRCGKQQTDYPESDGGQMTLIEQRYVGIWERVFEIPSLQGHAATLSNDEDLAVLVKVNNKSLVMHLVCLRVIHSGPPATASL